MGILELLHRLSALPRNKILRIEEFSVNEFAVHCGFHSKNPALLGCTIVKKRQKLMQMPPAWDDSLDTLERFNNLPEEWTVLPNRGLVSTILERPKSRIQAVDSILFRQNPAGHYMSRPAWL